VKRPGAGLLRGGFRFREHVNPPPPSKNPNAAAVTRGYGSLGSTFNSFHPAEPLPDLPEYSWGVRAMKHGLRDIFRAEESKWP